MDRLKRSRSANKRVFNNYKLQIDNELAEENPSIVNLKTLMELLASKWQIISQICQDIQDLIPCDDENEALLEQELEEESVLQSEFVRVRVLVEQKLSSLETAVLATASTSRPDVNIQSSLPHIPRLDVRLPKLELKHFGGNTFEWSSFWDCFNSTIHSKTNLEPVNKFSYLKSVLVEKAATAISGLELTDANYAVAINILKDRFGRKEVIINAHMNKLLSLPSVQKLSDVKALRRLYDDSEVTVRGLEALGVASGTYGSLLCPVLISKIPEKLAVDWNKRPTSSTDGIDDLIDFLKQEVDSRERSQMMRAGPSTSSHQSDSSRSRQDNKGNKSKMTPSASALMSSSQQSHQSQQSNSSFKRRISCIYCDSTDHYPISCKVPREEKVKTLHNKKCCLLCLRTGHGVKDCQHPRQKCCYCQKRHHPSICETPASSQTNSEKNDGGKSSNSTSVLAAGDSSDGVVFLQTASVIVSGLKIQKKIVCLLDGGSHKSFIRKSLADTLRLESQGTESLSIGTFGTKTVMSAQVLTKTTLCVQGDFARAQQLQITALKITDICDSVYHPGCDLSNAAELQGRQMADGRMLSGKALHSEIDLLIGADHYWKIVTGKVHHLSGGPTIISSHFGWLLHGPAKSRKNNFGSKTVSMMVQVAQHQEPEGDLNKQLSVLWELESMGISDNVAEDSSSQFLSGFEKSITTGPDGRNEVPLPFKENHVYLPNNRKQAEVRLQQLLRKLSRDKDLLIEYDAIIAAYEAEGMISVVSEDLVCEIEHYLPHRPVVKREKLSTKVRIVFDASAKEFKFLSLNECLEQGPNLNPELLAILLRIRLKKIAYLGDIEKAFLQVGVRIQDRDVLRFLWIDNISDINNAKIKVYRWNRVAFGITSSPFLLRVTINKHLKKYETVYPDTVKMVKQNLYVDDLLGGADDIEQAINDITKIKEIFQSACMNMRRWISNDPALTSRLQEKTESSSETCGILSPLIADGSKSTKILGMIWNTNEDAFMFDPASIIENARQDGAKLTKRAVLSTVSKIFDPLGLISPFVVTAKILLQEIWETGIGWDDALPEGLKIKWSSFVDDLDQLTKVKVPRWVLRGIEAKNEIELHLFSDASQKAYGAVAYLRAPSGKGFVTSLLTSKTRVAPLKTLTIPRLELMSAILAVRLAEYLVAELQIDLKRICFWMDSQVSLHWIKGNANRWKPFVKNRVEEIQKKFDPASWRFCPGVQNPADLPSRGVQPKELINNKLWWEGPDWLSKEESNWPLADESTQLNISNGVQETIHQEQKTTIMLTTSESKKEHLFNLQDISDLDKVFRITAWIQRFCRNFLKKANTRRKEAAGDQTTTGEQEDWTTVKVGNHQVQLLTSSELKNAELMWIRHVQEEVFPKEYRLLKEKKELPSESCLFPLRPVVDSDQQVIRASGRIEQLYEFEGKMPPIILPANHLFTEKIITRTHLRLFHSGVKTTMVALREKYWIVRGRQQIKKVIKACVICAKENSRPFSEVMAPLPLDRLRFCLPFERTGIDFAGPIYIRSSNSNLKVKKVYICLFSCAVTRAIHLELVSDLSAEYCLLAFKRFTARRGLCTTFYSDNAKTFSAINRTLKRIFKDQKIQQYLTTSNIKWIFSAAKAPWWGGFWERFVRTTKSILRKTLLKTTLNYEEMMTLLIECEAVINSRPLTYLSEDPEEEGALTPSLLLTGRRITSLPQELHQNIDTSSNQCALKRREKYRRELVKRWGQRWMTEYRQELLRHHCEWKSRNKIKVGDVVLIHDDNSRRQMWKSGVVVELIPGRDGRIRMVKLRTENGKISRPIQKLYPTELHVDEGESSIAEKPSEEKKEPDPVKPKAAIESGLPANPRGEDVGIRRSSRGRLLKPSYKLK